MQHSLVNLTQPPHRNPSPQKTPNRHSVVDILLAPVIALPPSSTFHCHQWSIFQCHQYICSISLPSVPISSHLSPGAPLLPLPYSFFSLWWLDPSILVECINISGKETELTQILIQRYSRSEKPTRSYTFCYGLKIGFGYATWVESLTLVVKHDLWWLREYVLKIPLALWWWALNGSIGIVRNSILKEIMVAGGH